MIENDLYSDLSTVTGLSSLFAVMAGKTVVVPYGVYNRISTQREQTLTNFGNTETVFQLDIYHGTRGAMLTIKAALIDRLKLYNQRQIGDSFIQSVEILNESETIEELNGILKFKGIVEFSVYYSE